MQGAGAVPAASGVPALLACSCRQPPPVPPCQTCKLCLSIKGISSSNSNAFDRWPNPSPLAVRLVSAHSSAAAKSSPAQLILLLLVTGGLASGLNIRCSDFTATALAVQESHRGSATKTGVSLLVCVSGGMRGEECGWVEEGRGDREWQFGLTWLGCMRC